MLSSPDSYHRHSYTRGNPAFQVIPFSSLHRYAPQLNYINFLIMPLSYGSHHMRRLSCHSPSLYYHFHFSFKTFLLLHFYNSWSLHVKYYGRTCASGNTVWSAASVVVISLISSTQLLLRNSDMEVPARRELFRRIGGCNRCTYFAWLLYLEKSCELSADCFYECCCGSSSSVFTACSKTRTYIASATTDRNDALCYLTPYYRIINWQS